MDEIHGSKLPIHMAGSQPIHGHYVQEEDPRLHHVNNGNLMDDDHDDCVGTEAIEGNLPSDNHTALVARGENENQLTLSFQGQVYVFDSVSPEKVTYLLLCIWYFLLFLFPFNNLESVVFYPIQHSASMKASP